MQLLNRKKTKLKPRDTNLENRQEETENVPLQFSEVGALLEDEKEAEKICSKLQSGGEFLYR